MARRNHWNNGGKHHSGGNWPQPPSKKVRRRFYSTRRVPTEVHRAFWSLGQDDRTKRLSDNEFYSQVGGEVGYLFRLSGAHFRRAASALGELFDELF